MSANTQSPPKRLLVIANPISGGGRSRALVPALCAALQARGVTAESYFTTCSGDASARAQQAADEAWDGLIAAGGDGTVNEVLNGMQDLDRPLGFLPLGTANVLGLEFGLPRDPESAAAAFAAGHLREHPIGECAGRRLLLFVGAGIDGAVVERLEQLRSGTLGKHKWIGPILHVLRRWPRHRLRATLACGTVLDDLSSVLVTRVRNFGGVFKLTPEIDPAGDKLHVLAFRAHSRTAWAVQGLRAFCGRLRPGRWLETHETDTVRIEGEAPYQIDGDSGGRTPVEVKLLDRPVRLFAPA